MTLTDEQKASVDDALGPLLEVLIADPLLNSVSPPLSSPQSGMASVDETIKYAVEQLKHEARGFAIEPYNLKTYSHVTSFDGKLYPRYRTKYEEFPEEIWKNWNNKGPIHTKYFDEDSLLIEEMWIIPAGPIGTEKFMLHRTDGPAFREWDEDGSILQQHWSLNGKRLTAEKHRRTLVLWSGRNKVFKAIRLLAMASVVPDVSDDTLSVVSQFL